MKSTNNLVYIFNCNIPGTGDIKLIEKNNESSWQKIKLMYEILYDVDVGNPNLIPYLLITQDELIKDNVKYKEGSILL